MSAVLPKADIGGYTKTQWFRYRLLLFYKQEISPIMTSPADVRVLWRRIALNSFVPSMTPLFLLSALKKARANGECSPLPSSTGSKLPEVITTRAFLRDIYC